MNENKIAYFGYGSLVNRTTRPASEPAISAHLKGWQRTWSHRVSRPGELDGNSSLNVREWHDADHTTCTGIDGVVATLDLADLPLLDARESGYDRRMVPVKQFDLGEEVAADEIAVYVSKRTHTFPADPCYPLLQSYIDCVMAGFLDRFGHAGLLKFLATTQGWQSPVLADRSSPRYVRAVQLDPDILDYFDSLLIEQRQAG